ncbi:MAG: hypothetical protein JOZ01_06305 [Candidatus Eremiobacteraeota bacterium]|nr:hypothetical protein [Candidatus Eremiobacteraeota bacterium]
MNGGEAFDVFLGHPENAHVRLEVVGYEHPDVAEPHGFDLLRCRVHASAEPVRATFVYSVRVIELVELRNYLMEINSGNGPAAGFAMAGGLLNLSFAPSRRGPVLCAVLLKNIDASHVRLEFMITLEPRDISAALEGLEHVSS